MKKRIFELSLALPLVLAALAVAGIIAYVAISPLMNALLAQDLDVCSPEYEYRGGGGPPDSLYTLCSSAKSFTAMPCCSLSSLRASHRSSRSS